MCPGSKLAITIGRCRRQRSPLAENTPLKPISLEMAASRRVRWKPSGRSRSTAAIVSGFASTRICRGPTRKRKASPYLRLHASAVRCSFAGLICSMFPRSGKPCGPGRSWMRRSLSTSTLRFCHIEEHAVHIGEAILAERAAGGEELEARFALAPGERLHAQVRVVVAQPLQALLERGEALDLEADMVGARAHDAGAFVVADAPGHDEKRHGSVAQVEVRVVALLVLQSENLDVEL